MTSEVIKMLYDLNGKGNLVRLLDIDKDFIIDLKYATTDNFTGQKVYSSGECWMDRHTAEILIKARDIFRRDGYRVKVLDAYRPISVQKKFWDIFPVDGFVAQPPDMSRPRTFSPAHLNGMAVDVTLTDADGNELEMPSSFDDFSDKAALRNAPLGSAGEKNASYLKEVMERVGFRAYRDEWWHFNDISTEPAPYMDFQI